MERVIGIFTDFDKNELKKPKAELKLFKEEMLGKIEEMEKQMENWLKKIYRRVSSISELQDLMKQEVTNQNEQKGIVAAKVQKFEKWVWDTEENVLQNYADVENLQTIVENTGLGTKI